jgi:hypothetical protein
VTRELDPDDVRRALDAALPDGLDIVDAVVARTSDFAARLEASLWRIEVPGADLEELTAARSAFWAAEEVLVERRAKSGLRTFDARGPVVRLDLREESDGQPCAILEAVVRHVTMSVRPDDVLAALRRVSDFEPPIPPRVTRLAQGPLDIATCAVGDPFAPDRED